jgi:hypothetical protein
MTISTSIVPRPMLSAALDEVVDRVGEQASHRGGDHDRRGDHDAELH